MLSLDMILTREMTAAVERGGGDSTSLQNAVDAVAHLELVLEGLDVDVRGAGLHRPLDRSG